jgi:uncharacterized membrane protein YgaE (UPF0421/DUF939 family)
MTPTKAIESLQLATRAAAGAGLALAAAQRLGLEFPLYAMISAVIVTDLSASRTRELTVPRLAGTALGTALGALFSGFLAASPWAVASAILVAALVTQAMGLDNATKLAGYVCGIVVLEHSGEPWSYALYRCIETLLGIGAAVLVSFVPKLLSPRASEPHKNATNGPRDSPR